MTGVKSEILKTSLKQFLKHGIRKMSNERLVGILGISTKTLYKYFKDREDLLSQALNLFYSRQYKVFEDFMPAESAPVLMFRIWQEGFEMEYNVNKKFFRDLHHYYPELESRVEAKHVKFIWQKLIQIIERGKKEGHMRKDIVPEATLESISVLYTSLVRRDEFDKLGISPSDLFLNTVTAYIRGICTDKGNRKLDKYISGLKVKKDSRLNQ